MVKKSDEKYYFAKCNHPLDLPPYLRDSFDYADYSLYPQDYHAIYITLDKDNDTLIYVCSQIINLEKTQSWDFVEIAKNTYKDLSTPTFKLQQFRRTYRTKDSQRTESAIYKSISSINTFIKKQTKKDIKIIINTKSGYRINIDPQKPYTLFIDEKIFNEK